MSDSLKLVDVILVVDAILVVDVILVVDAILVVDVIPVVDAILVAVGRQFERRDTRQRVRFVV